MKKFKTIALALLCVLSVCFWSCTASVGGGEENDHGISITLPGIKGRAVFHDIDEVASYTISVSQNGYSVTSKNAGPGETVRIKLTDTGTYDINVSAYDSNSTKIAEGTASVTLALGDGYKKVSIDIEPYETNGVGMNLSLNWVEGYIGETVTMGSWPQSLADVSGITLTATGKTYDGKNAEYSGSDSNKYVKVGNSYYKVEPITWRVIAYNSDGSKKLLADKIYSCVVYYGTTEGTRSIGDKTIYTNNYKYSNIRAYLNSTKNQFETDGGTPTQYDVDWTNAGFLTSAFTTTELAKIKTTLVDNSAATTDSSTNQYACENTEDKVYLLSSKEASKKLYGLGDYAGRKIKTTDYAKANGAYQSDTEGCGGDWWLRSPYCNNGSLYALGIGSDGNRHYNRVISNNVGVVPALTVTE